MKNEKDARITISVPASLREILKINAAKNDRSFSGEIVHCLKAGSGWNTKPEIEKAESPLTA